MIVFFLCSALAGLSVKIMDDWLDRERDGPRPTFATRLGDASLPYALLSFACAVPFDPATAVALLLMSYAAGMGGRALRDVYPSGLRGWQESLFAVIISVGACGWRLTTVAGLCIAAIQGIDDVMDWRNRGPSAAPLVRRFGVIEVAAGTIAAVLFALGLDIPRTFGVIMGAAFIWCLEALCYNVDL